MKQTKAFRIVALFLLMSCLISCKTDLGEIPEFNIRKSNQTEVNISTFINGKTSLVIRFDADCRSCQDGAQGIMDHLDELGDVGIVFVSEQDFEKIDLFDDYFKLSEQPNIIVGQDLASTVATHFNLYSTPLIALVDKKRHVRKVISGEIAMPELIILINEIR